MVNILDSFLDVSRVTAIIRTIIAVLIVLLTFNLVQRYVKRALLKRARTKKQISNVEIFSRVLMYLFAVVVILVAIFSFTGSLTGFGLSLGLLSAALGWALQKPITGIAAWVMIVTKRPFEIGDRIIIGQVRGDVSDISLTHIYLREVGGLVAGEENSGRMIMIPNSLLFEQNITNYTMQDEYVLNQVVVTVTYESDLDKAIKIAKDAARKHTKDFLADVAKEPVVRVSFEPSGMDVRVRYFAPAKRLQEIASSITKEVFDRITRTKNVEIAYPHTEVLYREKK